MIEYAGDTIRALDMAGRMTVSNMAIEGGARAGLIAPDETTFEYIRGRPMAPKGEALERAMAYWKTLPTDAGARFDRVVKLAAHEIAPQVTWGTSPEDVLPITGVVPNPEEAKDEARRAQLRLAHRADLGQQDVARIAVQLGIGEVEIHRPDMGAPGAAVQPLPRGAHAGDQPP